MQTLLLTIVGPQQKIDLEVPGEVPISDLIPILLEICGALTLPATTDSAQWSLRLVHEGTPLAATATLIEAGVLDGSILVLQDAASWASLHERDAQFTPRTVSPSASTGGIGVTWSKDDLLP